MRLLFEGGDYFFRSSQTTVAVLRALSPTVHHGNKLYNTNSPSAIPMTIVRNYLHMCVCVVYTSHGYSLREAFKTFDCAATVCGRRLFEGSVYSKKYSIVDANRKAKKWGKPGLKQAYCCLWASKEGIPLVFCILKYNILAVIHYIWSHHTVVYKLCTLWISYIDELLEGYSPCF